MKLLLSLLLICLQSCGQQAAPARPIPQVKTLIDFFWVEKRQVQLPIEVLVKRDEVNKNLSYRIWAFDQVGEEDFCVEIVLNKESGSLVRIASKNQPWKESKKINFKELEKRSKVLPEILKHPIDFNKTSKSYHASVEYSFILEGFSGNDYLWAVRNFRGEEGVDYKNIGELLSLIPELKGKIGW